jgi:ParB family chromosome partitioning protein
MDVLALRDSAQQQLQQIRDVETGVEYLNKVRAIEVWAKAEKKDAVLQNMIAEQKLRTQRILGQLIDEGQQRGEIATSGNPNFTIVPDGNNKKTLADIGISRKDSSNWKQIAAIPDDTFNGFIEEKKAAVDDAVGELTTAGMLAFAKGKPHVSNNSGENEWYTPAKFIESARVVMGSIDLDPASSEIANRTVKAETYYTKDDDGLTKPWFGNVWLNPPYAQPLMSMFSDAIVDKREQYDQAIVLVNNATETQWMRQMFDICDAVCFVAGRIKFIDMNGNPSGAPLQGQCILYFGQRRDEFKNEFYNYGVCMGKI